jgi:DNA processing protein
VPKPSNTSEPEAWLALGLIHGVGCERYRALLTAFGAPSAVLAATQGQLERVVEPKIAAAICAGADAAALANTLAWLDAPENHLLTLADDDYPNDLLEIADPPVLLYLKGRRELLSAPVCMAVVGSRNATPSGMQTAEAFSAALSAAGLTIVSGMALGIDSAAHAGGLKHNGHNAGSTIAVIGTGLDRVYPARNKALAQQIAKDGLIISEYSLGTPPLPANFPRRNRIISGLSRGVLVVEAALASGSLITARMAAEQGRDVFAIPGSIHSPFSKGCHLLIKQGAKLVDDAADILQELNLSAMAPVLSVVDVEAVEEKDAVTTDNTASAQILAAIGYEVTAIDSLIATLSLAPEVVIATLTELEIMGQIATLAGGRVQRLGA